MGTEPDLETTPGTWEELYGLHRAEIDADWISQHPGTRCEAWWQFVAPEGDVHEDEGEMAWLYDRGFLEAAEIELLQQAAIRLTLYNRERRSNFCLPSLAVVWICGTDFIDNEIAEFLLVALPSLAQDRPPPFEPVQYNGSADIDAFRTRDQEVARACGGFI
jgi:hypothetical protein